jgi:prepilin-type N-terminal cleavage/methylation domain-containing protein
MKTKSQNQKNRAFTLVELIVVCAVLGMVALVILPALAQDEQSAARAKRINCSNNLRQVSLAYKVWAVDNNDRLPMTVPVQEGGTKEFAAGGNAFRHFQVMSNEINAPKILICPADSRKAATSFGDLQNKNTSYFVGLDATDLRPKSLLSGDRNLDNGVAPVRTVLELRSDKTTHWTDSIHVNEGNIGLSDGSVILADNAKLQELLQKTGDATNRIALPE